MSKAILIRGARQLLTLRGATGTRRGHQLGELGLVEDGAVLIRDGLIREVGSARRVENLSDARGAQELSAAGCVVMPGFVDCHTHLVFGPPRLEDFEQRLAGRSYEEIATADGGILRSVQTVRSWTSHKLAERANHFLRAMAAHGTTTVEAKSGYGLDEAAELKQLRILRALDGAPLDIVPTFLGAHATPPEFAGRPDAYIHWLCDELLPLVAARKLARFADVYCDRNAFTVAQAERYLTAAAALRLGLKAHASQFASLGAATLAARLGAVSVDHLENASAEEIRTVAASHSVAVLLPGSVYHLGLERHAPARALIEAGAAVALATDFNPGSSPTFSMQMALALACTALRMSPAEALTAATINAAHAIGMAARIGSLEPGKQADLVVLDCGDYREIPYFFGANHVLCTIKHGRVIYRRSEPVWPAD